MAKKRKGIAARIASAAKARLGRVVRSAGTPKREIPPPTDYPSAQGNQGAGNREVSRATTKPNSTRTTKKTAPSRSRVMVDEFEHVSSGGYKGAARKAPGGPLRGGKR